MRRAIGFRLLFTISALLFVADERCWAQANTDKSQTQEQAAQGEEQKKILVEVFLAPEHKENVEKIKQEFEAVSITRFRSQVYRLGNPPQNIAIGKNVPASVGRLALRLAGAYNRGVKYLLPEYRFFPDHIAIGSSAFDEKSQIPIRPEDLKQLEDPSLSTEEFHKLYRHLTGEDVHLPKYTD